MKRKLSISLLTAATLFALGGCGNIDDSPKTANAENKDVKASASVSTADEAEKQEFKCFYSGAPDEKFDVAADKLEEFSECYENMKNNWELVSESTVEEMSDTYGGLFYTVETYDDGEVISEMSLLRNLDLCEDVSDVSCEVMLVDKRTDTVRTMKCDNGDYIKIYQLVQNSI